MHHDSAKRHIFGALRTPAAMTPNSNSAESFVQFTYPQVSSSYVYSFGTQTLVCWHTNTQIHKQTDAAENIQSSSLRYDVG